jgi:hypothetical protein
MRLFLCFLAAAVAAEAGVVRGVVQEHVSGLPMARTFVRLFPVPKGGGENIAPVQVRSDRSGQFLFSNVPEGLYLLMAVREGYFPAAYGQRRPTGQGTPIQVTHDSDFFTQLGMRHKGAITGRVLDENGVGIEGVPVVAYRARLPLRSVGRATSDDRGVYRIHGMDPGKYWVRSAAYTLDDGSGLLPTFGPQSREAVQARVHQVSLDADTLDADIHTEPGALFRLRGVVQCLAGPVAVTLSSETGRKSTQAVCNVPYMFEGLAPGLYEVFAELPGGTESGYTELFLDHDSESGNVRVMPPPKVDFEVRRAGSTNPGNIPMTLMGRRQDLSEVESDHGIDVPRATLSAGHWEMHASVGPGQYIESIANLQAQARRSRRAEQPVDAYDVFIDFQLARVRITFSDQAAKITGTVMRESKPVPGAPVFLWPVAEAARRSLHGSLQVLSDVEGRYHFEGVPPGDYRLLATSDVSEVDEQVLGEARALTVSAEATRQATVELPLWIAP